MLLNLCSAWLGLLCAYNPLYYESLDDPISI